MKRKLIKKIVTAAIAGTMVSGVCMNVSAGDGLTDATVKSYEEQIEDIRRKQEIAKNELEKVRNEQYTTYTEIGALDELISYNNSLKDLAEGQLDTIEIQITEKKANILEAEEDIAKQYDAFLDRMVQVYMDDNTDYIEMILGAESLVDFLTRVDKVSAIFEYDEKLIQSLNENKKILEREKATLLEAEETQQKRVAELEKAIKDNQALYDTKLDYITDLANNEEKWTREYNYNKQLEEQKNQELENYLAELQKKTQSQYVGGALGWPLALDVNYYVSSEQGWRNLWGNQDYHLGIDLACANGSYIYAANGGTVLVSEYHYSYGNYVLIDHGGGISTLYAHMSSRLVSAGQTVTAGQHIGYVGLTGNTSGYHLHFETRVNGKVDNPRNYIVLP